MGEIVAGVFRDKVDRAEVVELIRLLGHIRSRSILAVHGADAPVILKASLSETVLTRIELLREALEEVKENV